MIKSIVLISLLGLISCTENQRAKSWGGSATVDIPTNNKFISATWKDQELWYSYRPMRKDEYPETVVLKEQASFGMMEGEVHFKESK